MGYYLEDILTGERVPATISRLSKPEILLLDKSKRFHFKWKKELDCEVYGLRIDDSGETVGMVSFEYKQEERAVQIRLIANAKEHTGPGKRLDRIAGSLFAFVCINSANAGFDGYVFLKPKTNLIGHYRAKYGFRNTGTSMFSDTINSQILVRTYYESRDKERVEDH